MLVGVVFAGPRPQTQSQDAGVPKEWPKVFEAAPSTPGGDLLISVEPDETGAHYIPGRILISLKISVQRLTEGDIPAARNLAQSFGGRLALAFRPSIWGELDGQAYQTFAFHLPDNAVSQVIEALKRNPNVLDVSRSHVYDMADEGTNVCPDGQETTRPCDAAYTFGESSGYIYRDGQQWLDLGSHEGITGILDIGFEPVYRYHRNNKPGIMPWTTDQYLIVVMDSGVDNDRDQNNMFLQEEFNGIVDDQHPLAADYWCLINDTDGDNWYGGRYCYDENDPTGHGTAVISMMARQANNNTDGYNDDADSVGIFWFDDTVSSFHPTIILAKVTGGAGSVWVDAVIAALDEIYLWNNDPTRISPVQIVNMSWGYNTNGSGNATINNRIHKLATPIFEVDSVMFFAATGNDGRSTGVWWPAKNEDVWGIGGVNMASGERYTNSNYCAMCTPATGVMFAGPYNAGWSFNSGSGSIRVLCDPDSGNCGTDRTPYYAVGTSLATPIVAGIAAYYEVVASGEAGWGDPWSYRSPGNVQTAFRYWGVIDLEAGGTDKEVGYGFVNLCTLFRDATNVNWPITCRSYSQLPW